MHFPCDHILFSGKGRKLIRDKIGETSQDDSLAIKSEVNSLEGRDHSDREIGGHLAKQGKEQGLADELKSVSVIKTELSDDDSDGLDSDLEDLQFWGGTGNISSSHSMFENPFYISEGDNIDHDHDKDDDIPPQDGGIMPPVQESMVFIDATSVGEDEFGDGTYSTDTVSTGVK